ncbi:hypothetical protein BDW71DRAFT_193271 [Aspergillus fruticulosus]
MTSKPRCSVPAASDSRPGEEPAEPHYTGFRVSLAPSCLGLSWSSSTDIVTETTLRFWSPSPKGGTNAQFARTYTNLDLDDKDRDNEAFVSAGHIEKEALRLYPPARQIRRTFKFKTTMS